MDIKEDLYSYLTDEWQSLGDIEDKLINAVPNLPESFTNMYAEDLYPILDEMAECGILDRRYFPNRMISKYRKLSPTEIVRKRNGR